MSEHYADLRMYVAPEPIQQANQYWLARILERLKLHRLDARIFPGRAPDQSIWFDAGDVFQQCFNLGTGIASDFCRSRDVADRVIQRLLYGEDRINR